MVVTAALASGAQSWATVTAASAPTAAEVAASMDDVEATASADTPTPAPTMAAIGLPAAPASAERTAVPDALLELPSGPLGIPRVVLTAYRSAADTLAMTQPGCHLPWTLLAGIGRIESGHAAGGLMDASGTTLGSILGPLLDGSNPGDGVVVDGDRDGKPTYERAVGPMQFLPSTWSRYGADGNHDGVADPNNIFDAALGAGGYLCSGGLDVADPIQVRTAVYRYNHSEAYVSNVLSWAAAYANGVAPTDLAPTPVPTATDHPAPSPAPTAAATTRPAAPTPTTSATPITTATAAPTATTGHTMSGRPATTTSPGVSSAPTTSVAAVSAPPTTAP